MLGSEHNFKKLWNEYENRSGWLSDGHLSLNCDASVAFENGGSPSASSHTVAPGLQTSTLSAL